MSTLFFTQHKGARQFLDTKPKSQPFFMMLSTPACHAPFTPAPQYNGSFADKQAPRNGSYNVKAKVGLGHFLATQISYFVKLLFGK